MNLFATWIAEALSPLAEVRMVAAPPVFLNRRTQARAWAKWMAYLDQYVLLTLRLGILSHSYDLVLVADHGNAPSTLLTPASRLAVMVHDTIAMRQALGRIPEAPRTSLSGRVLQAAIRRAIARARLVMSNPGCIPGEIRALGLAEAPVPVGCPIDRRRLDHPPGNAAPERRYVLNVASDGWRKRKTDLIPLWLEVQKREALTLVLAGHTTPDTLRRFTDAGVRDVLVMNDVDEITLADLYRGCQALITVSHEEGLCIPVIEALSFGKLVFAPDISPSYVDVFGAMVNRFRGSPEDAAKSLLAAIACGSRPDAAATLLDWFSRARFYERVRTTVSGLVNSEDENGGLRAR